MFTGCSRDSTDKGLDDGPTAAAMSEEFKKDAKAAEKKYADQTVTLSGTILSVLTKDDTGKDHVTLVLEGLRKSKKEDDGPNIECAVVRDSESKALALIETQKVKVTGKFKKFAKDPDQPHQAEQIYLEQCKLEVVGPDPTITVSAAELGKAFATDAAAARQKFENKVVLVEGRFLTTKHLQYIGPACVVEGHNSDGKSFNIIVLGSSEKLGNPAQGDTVKIRATCEGQRTVDGSSHVALLGPKLVK
jgi:hypothetical protein